MTILKLDDKIIINKIEKNTRFNFIYKKSIMKNNKKILIKTAAVVLCLITVFSFTFSCFSDKRYSIGSYVVTDENGQDILSAQEAGEKISVAPEGAVLTTIKIVNGMGYIKYDGVYGWVDLSKLYYRPDTPSVIDGDIENLKSIEISSLPDKVVYTQGDTPETDGLAVTAVFSSDGKETRQKVTGYTISFPDMDSYGEKRVTVYYGGKTAGFEITVKKIPVSYITVTLPTKTVFALGEPVSFDGMKVRAFYSDGRDSGLGILLDKDDYTVVGVKEGDASLKSGSYTVTVKYLYDEITASFHIYVEKTSVVSLLLTSAPKNMYIYQGQTFNKNDFKISAADSSGAVTEVTDFDLDYDNTEVGSHTGTISYGGRKIYFSYEVRKLEETGIEVSTGIGIGNFAGSPVNFSGLKVYAVYNSGERKEISDYEIDYDFNPSVPGEYKATVFHGDFSAEFSYTVADVNSVILGDVDLNGEVNSLDARLTLRYSASLTTLKYAQRKAADVDANGKITALDARKILRASAKLEPLT